MFLTRMPPSASTLEYGSGGSTPAALMGFGKECR
jgi:hypothetical protein